MHLRNCRHREERYLACLNSRILSRIILRAVLRALIHEWQRGAESIRAGCLSSSKKSKQIRARFPRVRPSIHPPIHPSLRPSVPPTLRPIPRSRVAHLVLSSPIPASSVQPHTYHILHPPIEHVLSFARQTFPRFAPSRSFSRLFPPSPRVAFLPKPPVSRVFSSLVSLSFYLSFFALTRARERWARKSTDDICRT